jgi:hypothetical protein
MLLQLAVYIQLLSLLFVVDIVTQHLRAYTNGTVNSLWERNCGTETLIDLWQVHCCREHPVETEKYSSGSLAPPKSWRILFFVRDFVTLNTRSHMSAGSPCEERKTT